MSVYRNGKSPYYQYDFQLNGVRFHGSTKSKSKRDAEKFEALKREEAREHLKTVSRSPRAPMTINIAFDRFWVEVGSSYRGSAGATFFSSLAWLLNHFGKNALLKEIGKREISEAIGKRRGEGVKNATVNRTVTEPLRRVMNRARKHWEEPVKEVDWRDFLLPEPKERIRELRADEEIRVFEVMRPDYHPVIEFALLSGFRLFECVGLRWKDINWGALEITIRGKGDKVEVIPMTVEMRDLLWSLQGHHEEKVFTYVASRTVRRKKLIKGVRYPVTYEGLKTAWRRHVSKAKVEDFRFHDLRHTTGTRLLRATGNLKLTQKLLRHEDIQTTTKYAHANNDDLRAAMEKVSESRKKSRNSVQEDKKAKEV